MIYFMTIDETDGTICFNEYPGGERLAASLEDRLARSFDRLSGKLWQAAGHVAGRMGASFGAALTGMDGRDALVIVTKPPYASRAIEAAHPGAAQGGYVVVITDSPACPALERVWRKPEVERKSRAGVPRRWTPF